MPKFNRRQFLGSTAAAAAFAAAPAIVQAAVVEKKVDLVIVGGGLAGLAAANAAVKTLCFSKGCSNKPRRPSPWNLRYSRSSWIFRSISNAGNRPRR